MFDDVLRGRIGLDIEIGHFEWPQSEAERPSSEVLGNVAEWRIVRLRGRLGDRYPRYCRHCIAARHNSHRRIKPNAALKTSGEALRQAVTPKRLNDKIDEHARLGRN